jgi:hypothetical protein
MASLKSTLMLYVTKFSSNKLEFENYPKTATGMQFTLVEVDVIARSLSNEATPSRLLRSARNDRLEGIQKLSPPLRYNFRLQV